MAEAATEIRGDVLHMVDGEPSWRLAAGGVSVAVTQHGGHLGPARFEVGEWSAEPMSVAPWAGDVKDGSLPAVLRVLRGDFFCMPFGGNDVAYEGPTMQERHPVHGETANRAWHRLGGATGADEATLELGLETLCRAGSVQKSVRLVAGHPVVYQRHRVLGMLGPMTFGHHAMLRFGDDELGRVSLSSWSKGCVYPGAFEEESKGGRQSLEPGARFDRLDQVPQADGGAADLSVYPAREGYEDLVQIINAGDVGLGWSAVSVSGAEGEQGEGGWVWFSLKRVEVLPTTVLWMSNGGRDYEPWNGRHRRVLGVEDIVGYFHEGLAPSVGDNAWREEGVATSFSLRPDRGFVLPYVFGCVPRPSGFGRVTAIEPGGQGVVIRDQAGQSIDVAVDLSWLDVAGDEPG